jgi:hypothetical protein
MLLSTRNDCPRRFTGWMPCFLRILRGDSICYLMRFEYLN